MNKKRKCFFCTLAPQWAAISSNGAFWNFSTTCLLRSLSCSSIPTLSTRGRHKLLTLVIHYVVLWEVLIMGSYDLQWVFIQQEGKSPPPPPCQKHVFPLPPTVDCLSFTERCMCRPWQQKAFSFNRRKWKVSLCSWKIWFWEAGIWSCSVILKIACKSGWIYTHKWMRKLGHTSAYTLRHLVSSRKTKLAKLYILDF